MDDLWKLMFMDVHLEAIHDSDDVYVALPGEDVKEGQCAGLRKWRYGMRRRRM